METRSLRTSRSETGVAKGTCEARGIQGNVGGQGERARIGELKGTCAAKGASTVVGTRAAGSDPGNGRG